jgi:hypothetical protein
MWHHGYIHENPPSRVQDLRSFPRFAELNGQGIEAILGPGDLLRGSLETETVMTLPAGGGP